MTLRVEREPTRAAGPGERSSRGCASKLQVRFQVEVLPAGTLPRTVHKAKRVIRE